MFLLRQYILNEREVETKTELWMKQNEDYLKEQKGQRSPRRTSPPVVRHSLHTLP